MREVKNLTQEEMADQLNMSTSGYAKIERGETKLYHDKLDKIADVFGVSVNQLLPSSNEGVTVCMSEQNDCSNTVYYGENSHKLAQLELIISYKDEIITQKDELLKSQQREIELLRQQIGL